MAGDDAPSPLREQQVKDMREIAALGDQLVKAITKLGTSRELSIAKTKIEEGVMWTHNHISQQ